MESIKLQLETLDYFFTKQKKIKVKYQQLQFPFTDYNCDQKSWHTAQLKI